MKFVVVLLILAAIVAVVLVVRARKNSRKPVQVQSAIRDTYPAPKLSRDTQAPGYHSNAGRAIDYSGSTYASKPNKPTAKPVKKAQPKPYKHSDNDYVGYVEPDAFTEPTTSYPTYDSSDSGYSSGSSGYSSGSSDSGGYSSDSSGTSSSSDSGSY